MTAPDISWQPTLLDATVPPDVDPSFTGIERTHLDDTSWVDHLPGWVQGADTLFDDLVASTDWGQRTRWMYDRRVDEPRLTAGWSASSGTALEPPLLERMRVLLSERYGVELDSMGLNLYRDGRDSVAWHSDRIVKEIEEPIVALVSVG